MEQRRLGASGLRVPALAFGAGTFGGRGELLFGNWGRVDVDEARRLVDICLDAGVTMFDTADVYSDGASEEVLGSALEGRRDRALVSTKTTLPLGTDDSGGSSRSRLLGACDAALRRLDTDHIDLYQLHAFDAGTPIEETLSTLDDLVRAGKVRYLGVSNFAGWQLMKSLSTADRHHLTKYVAHQVYYSLVGRDYEWELMPLGLDQGVGAVVWSPLGWGRLTGRVRRGNPLPTTSRLHQTASYGPPVSTDLLYRVVDTLEEIAAETERTVPQVALNWLLRRPTVSSVLIGARNETQLRENLGAAGWELTTDQVARLDAASTTTAPYPYFPYQRQEGFAQLNPSAV
ncbi:aldo/keto reductase [Actinophytocola oryzae]|uniref:Aryl-alcohol dehydrogenase-like predicted oxidoreductase n=1 Tax=Actinophytocola oryzae TaxID=502181 RepID=A0A4R7VVI0_9PSEU|nr:aldo/keto reductase [Actinophytocola oryzae]TDV53894.1 aryl-alcohol dehydrogenase-like predicted oxidoreductase [Actinophytocola oryzae]